MPRATADRPLGTWGDWPSPRPLLPDPVYYRSSCHLAPEGEAANRAYALLCQVMRDANNVAIGTVVMRNKEHPVAIRPDVEVLMLQTMYFAEEIRSPTEELPALPTADAMTDRELQMAGLLLQSMESDWDPRRYDDTLRQQLEAIIEAERQGGRHRHRDRSPTGLDRCRRSDGVLSTSIDSVQHARPPTRKSAVSPSKRTVVRPSPLQKTAKEPRAKSRAGRKAS